MAFIAAAHSAVFRSNSKRSVECETSADRRGIAVLAGHQDAQVAHQNARVLLTVGVPWQMHELKSEIPPAIAENKFKVRLEQGFGPAEMAFELGSW